MSPTYEQLKEIERRLGRARRALLQARLALRRALHPAHEAGLIAEGDLATQADLDVLEQVAAQLDSFLRTLPRREVSAREIADESGPLPKVGGLGPRRKRDHLPTFGRGF